MEKPLRTLKTSSIAANGHAVRFAALLLLDKVTIRRRAVITTGNKRGRIAQPPFTARKES